MTIIFRARRGSGIEIRYQIIIIDLQSPGFYEAFKKNAHSYDESVSFKCDTFVSLYSHTITKVKQTSNPSRMAITLVRRS